MKIEFNCPKDSAEILMRIDGGAIVPLDYTEELHKTIIMRLFNKVRENYSDCFKALHALYSLSAQYHYMLVRRFVKCNLSELDSIPDFDDNDFEFHFEIVPCPMRGECKLEGIVCNPKLNSSLSEKEMAVANLIAENLTDAEIANTLHIPVETVSSRRKAILKKLGLPNKQAVALWIYKFKNPTI